MKKFFAALIVLLVCTFISVSASDQPPPGETQTCFPMLKDNSFVSLNVNNEIINQSMEFRHPLIFEYNCMVQQVASNVFLSVLGTNQLSTMQLFAVEINKFIRPIASSGAFYWLSNKKYKVKPLLL